MYRCKTNFRKHRPHPITRERLIDAHIEWVENKNESGWTPFSLTIHFRTMPGVSLPDDALLKRVHRVYSYFLARMYRRPRAVPVDARPLLIGLIEQSSGRQVQVGIEDGRHVHAVLAVPPTIKPRRFERAMRHLRIGLSKIVSKIHVEQVRNTKGAVFYMAKQWGWMHRPASDWIVAPLRSDELPEKQVNRLKRKAASETLIGSRAANAPRSTSKSGDSDMKKSRTFTRQEIADRLKISLGRLDAMRKEGNGPPEFAIGRSIRFYESDVKAWLEKRTSLAGTRRAERSQKVDIKSPTSLNTLRTKMAKRKGASSPTVKADGLKRSSRDQKSTRSAPRVSKMKNRRKSKRSSI
jgi:excisionase family DNA binding protein